MFEKYFKEIKSNTAIRVSVVSIFVNIFLSLAKLIAGIVGASSAMVSDAVHSVSDVLSTAVVIAGVKMSEKEADKEHPYGHARMECVAAIVLAVMLALVGAGIGFSGLSSIISGGYNDSAVPSLLPLIAAVVSVAIKEIMFWYTRSAAVKLNSGALRADAWHHRSDALSSVGSFIGILFARIGFPIMDSIASVIISLCIIKVAYDIFIDGINKMVDHSASPEDEDMIRSAALTVEGVEGIDDLKTRLFGAKLYVDMEISADGNLTLTEAHSIAEAVHDAIEKKMTNCIHCMVHINPSQKPTE